MGWKRVKDHYQISYLVHANEKGEVIIGSPHVPKQVIINQDGHVSVLYEPPRNSALANLIDSMKAEPGVLAELVCSEDTFAASLPVFTYKGGALVELKCEALGYPNVTHDGQIQYENTHSADSDQVVRWAKECALLRRKGLHEYRSRLETQMKEADADIAANAAEIEQLAATYPHVIAEDLNDQA